MQLTYTDNPNYQFPFWLVHTTNPAGEDLNHIMDINQWCGAQFGELGVAWGYERIMDTQRAPQGLNPVKIRIYYTDIVYSWRFKNKEDAMTFKLTWGGA